MKRFFAVLTVAALTSTFAAATAPNGLAADPSPSPSGACTKPAARSFEVSPTRVAAGDNVRVTANVEDLCKTTQPAHTITVYAQRPQDAAPVEVARTTSDEHGSAIADVRVPESETLTAKMDDKDQLYSTSVGSTSVYVTVDRISGSCAGAITLSGPATAATGSTARVQGASADTATVNILFRKRGQNAFQVRRTITPRPDGTFSVAYTADDDYWLYASGSRCDSRPVLIQAGPVITGPPTAVKGSTVALVVRAPAGLPVKVYFHRAGTSGYQLGRMATINSRGRFSTTYRATADYRYYATVGSDRRQSNIGLTRLR